jgi:predicted nucleotide-binding protein
MSLAAIVARTNQLIQEGFLLENFEEYQAWSQRAYYFLLKAYVESIADEFKSLEGVQASWKRGRSRQVGLLEGLSSYTSEQTEFPEPAAMQPPSPVSPIDPKKVFVVHGHDHGSKEAVARYLERLGLKAVILHEKANEGLTVIEKIEAHSGVGFAVVLLTPDDVGAAKAAAKKLQARARQNVVLELGYFLGKLKRNRVCALYVPGVEIPSDFQGVLYIEFDAKGAWRTHLAQELSNARLPINVEGLLNS